MAGCTMLRTVKYRIWACRLGLLGGGYRLVLSLWLGVERVKLWEVRGKSVGMRKWEAHMSSSELRNNLTIYLTNFVWISMGLGMISLTDDRAAGWPN